MKCRVSGKRTRSQVATTAKGRIANLDEPLGERHLLQTWHVRKRVSADNLATGSNGVVHEFGLHRAHEHLRSVAYNTPCSSSRSVPPSSMTQRTPVRATQSQASCRTLAGTCSSVIPLSAECLLANLDEPFAECDTLELATAEERALLDAGASSEEP